MGDVFKEQIVKRASTTKTFAMKAGLVFLVIVIFLACTMIFPQVAVIVAAAAGFGAYYLTSFLDVEYEYIFTNGELDIDAIYSKSRRKKVYSGIVKDIEIMAHVDDDMHKGDFNNVEETKNCYSGVKSNNTYAFMTNIKGKRTKIVFEPNDMMLQAIKTVLTPRKLFIKN